MRLTLRTLLSYLDDTLEPAQARIIGQKMGESEQARELSDRIRQVTRRRRLMTPPVSGPGGIDPNTIAEYLDNEVTPEQAAEVEQICLASDVHLAEVAACHQILTLVLGEPALVPPSAKRRMYGLVKGPEAIPFRKPPRSDGKVDQDLSTELSPEADESLRLGVPAFGQWSDWRNRLLLFGGGVLATCLLVLALFQLMRPNSIDRGEGQQVAENIVVPVEPPKTEKHEEVKKAPTPVEEKKVEEKQPEDKNLKFAPKEIKLEVLPDVPFAAPEAKETAVGSLVAGKEPATLLQLAKDGEWKRVPEKQDEVYTRRPLLSLPGTINTVNVGKGVRLVLLGMQPEVSQSLLMESAVELYVPQQQNADLTLLRGRIMLVNDNGDKPAFVRVRFEDPKQGKQEYFDIALLNKDTTVILDRFCFMPPSEPFYPDPKNTNRVGPTAEMYCAVVDGSARVKYGDVFYTLGAPPAAYLFKWNSNTGPSDPRPEPELAAQYRPEPPPLPAELQKNPELMKKYVKMTADAVKAAGSLSRQLETKAPDVTLAETLNSPDPAARRLAIRCYGAMDDLGTIVNRFDQDSTKPDVRGACLTVLKQWIAYSRDNDYRLFDKFKERYKPSVSQKIMELLHYLPRQALSEPETYQTLIDDLNNPVLPVRELSAWWLYNLVPAGHKIGYAPTGTQREREAARAAWLDLVPRNTVPVGGNPATAPPPTGKKQ